MNRRTKRHLRTIVIISVVILIIILGFYAYRTFSFFKTIGVSSQNIRETILKKPKTTYTSVLLGYGGSNHEGAYLTDTIILVHINTKTKQVLLVSIPRDVWVKLPTKSKIPFFSKVNTIYELQLFPQTYPDVKVKALSQEDNYGMLKQVFQQISGLEIDSYIALDFSAFVKIIDVLGGVDVQVDQSFTDKLYPIDGNEKDLCGKKEEDMEELEKIATESPELAYPCRYETVSFSAGTNHLNGIQALKYARSRQAPEDGGDFARAKRQHKVIAAIKDKLLTPLMIPKLSSLMSQLESEVQTDAEYQDIEKLLKQIPQANQYQITTIVLSTDNYLASDHSTDGQYILVPKKGKTNWTKVKKDIAKLSQGINLSPTPKPTSKPK